LDPREATSVLAFAMSYIVTQHLAASASVAAWAAEESYCQHFAMDCPSLQTQLGSDL
jgi:hypothetical protein